MYWATRWLQLLTLDLCMGSHPLIRFLLSAARLHGSIWGRILSLLCTLATTRKFALIVTGYDQSFLFIVNITD